jgi:mannose/fructose-specific phosphotransferase system component IIA
MDKYRCQIITNVELVIRRVNQQTKEVEEEPESHVQLSLTDSFGGSP